MHSSTQWRLPYSFVKQHGVILLPNAEGQLYVYYKPNINWLVLTEIYRILQCEFILESVNETQFQHYLAICYQNQLNLTDTQLELEDNLDLSAFANQLPINQDLLDNSDDAPIIRLINAILAQAIKNKASDIHIETYEHHVLVRNRIDGVLQAVLEVSRAAASLIISRVKVMAKLDIAEKRLPQDGRIRLQVGGHSIDVRVSTLPSNHGERVVMRILDQQAAQLDLNLLGISASNVKIIQTLVHAPYGIILITGPTGSGKTTSLYAMLNDLNQVDRNILTIEDPIEYDLPGIGQTQVNIKTNMTFAKGLRAILRQDPDVVMIGEIRDLETAEIAIQASLTGHLVLSTLHTNTALGAISRLMDMGVEPFLLATSLIGLIAQRLVRKLCSECKELVTLTEKEHTLLQQYIPNYPDYPGFTGTIARPIGCSACGKTGYRGRTSIYEVIAVDEHLRTMIHKQDSLQVMEQFMGNKIPSIQVCAYEKVLLQQTSFAEVLRVIN